MMNLTKENIQFIDTYLEQSDVKHIDIRMEMVDHVASEIENRIDAGDTRDFYYVFKDYMLEHKSFLLENNNRFLRQTTKKLSNQLLKSFFSIKSITLLAVFTAIIYFGFNNYDSELMKNVLLISMIFLIIAPAICYFFALKKFNYNRFSGIERLGFFFSFLLQFINIVNITGANFIKNQNHLLITSIVMALVFTFILVFIRLSVLTFKDYKYRYNNLC
ncbi:hypothetical protein DFQ10_101198 [Winogradskyella eximia]|uniref:Uncharacterized protein n=1 Tax=Winogradskyella eximia TaxID=262006 RepID=A0A3D9HAC3_9FLAO|nr:hypothetical protein [Winogradskyella eximia]RED46428.1 hypothetical protein DFQ10_101198 [Winogradskyella eximia]